MPTLEQRQTAMRLKNKRRLDAVAETKVRCSIYLLLASGDDDLDALARRFDRSREWMKDWVAAKCPLFPYF
jgi:hypothetical protein